MVSEFTISRSRERECDPGASLVRSEGVIRRNYMVPRPTDASSSIELSVVVPCFNERDSLQELYKRVTESCVSCVGDKYELVFINDGSSDGTREELFRLAELDEHVSVLDLSRNYGHQIALTAGLEFCQGGRVFVIDADLQDPPELLSPLMRKMDEGYDVVYGQRMSREGETAFKIKTASAFYRLLRRFCDEADLALDTGDFRLMSRRAVDHLNAMPERYRFIRGMVSWIGLKQCAFPYVRRRRFAGQTHYPLRKMVLLALDAMTSFSIVPLRLASYAGFAFGILGFLLLTYALFGWASGQTVPGWASLAAIILILGSVQLVVLGIFGEYLGRMYIESKRRPLYIINELRSGRLRNNLAEYQSVASKLNSTAV